MSAHDTPIPSASAVATPAGRPPSIVACAMTALAVVAMKIQAPGFRITIVTPRRVGPSDGRRQRLIGVVPGERAELDHAERP